MYLSRIKLNLSNPAARRMLTAPQQVHASVENCFGGDSELHSHTEESRKLWRIDSLESGRYLLILSPGKPDFTRFCEQYGSDAATGITKDYEPLLSKLSAGQKWRFRLRGNAEHSVSTVKGERGKVMAHVTAEYQRSWLTKKAPGCGFILEEGQFDVVETEQLRFWRKSDKPPVTIGVAVFEGVLQISDEALFKAALTNGFGRAKAYGCGLLTLANYNE